MSKKPFTVDLSVADPKRTLKIMGGLLIAGLVLSAMFPKSAPVAPEVAVVPTVHKIPYVRAAHLGSSSADLLAAQVDPDIQYYQKEMSDCMDAWGGSDATGLYTIKSANMPQVTVDSINLCRKTANAWGAKNGVISPKQQAISDGRDIREHSPLGTDNDRMFTPKSRRDFWGFTKAQSEV